MNGPTSSVDPLLDGALAPDRVAAVAVDLDQVQLAPVDLDLGHRDLVAVVDARTGSRRRR